MKIKVFLKELQEELEIENINLELKTRLKDCDEWDSMSALVLIAYAESKFSVNLGAEDIKEIDTVESLAKKLNII